MKNNNALILFIKLPRPGYVKTRLQPELTPQQSVIIYRAMVEDTICRIGEIGFCDIKIFFYPADAAHALKKWLGNRFKYIPQQGKDLGEKMHNAITLMLEENYNKVIVIGSDIPTLDSATITKAFSGLEDNDLVLGPCPDGGYYLIGMEQLHPELFQGISWSTEYVLVQTLQRVYTDKLKAIQIESKSDIDTYQDLYQFWNSLKKQKLMGRVVNPSKIYNVMKKIFNS
jgi:rSAM/selenodomain-associated transferase 1